MKDIETVAVLGAGQMGAGIAQTAAQAGCLVLLADIDRQSAEKGIQKIRTQLGKLVEKGKMSSGDLSAILDRMVAVDGLKDLGKAGLVIEAVSENPDLKYKIFRDLDATVGADVILASNTSSISITKIAAQTKHPERVVGMHFMNPVPVMKLVEMIRGLQTSEDVFRRACATVQRFGKTTVEANDVPGFAVNRILMPMINEAVFTLEQGVASREGIDTAMKLGTNQPMGPLELADFIGLDTCLAIMEVLHDGLGDSKYRPCPLLKKYVDAGYLGRKSGRGFFEYARS